MSREDNLSAIENLLGFKFESAPKTARFPLPETPKAYLKEKPNRPFPHPSMVITPEMAKDMLMYRVIRIDRIPSQRRHNEMTRNRRFLMGTLTGNRRKGLIDVVRDGEFNNETSTPIVFTKDGYLLDGQHRLAACFLAKKPIEQPVTTNGQWGTFSVLDIGRARSAGQLLGEDIPYPDKAAATAKLILPVLQGTERRDWSVDGSNQDIYDLVHGWPFFQETWEGSGSWMKHVLQAARSRIPMTALAASVMMALAAGANPDHVQEFLNGLTPGYRDGFPTIGKAGEDPRHLLRRQYLIKSTTKVTGHERREQVSSVRRAMEVWLEWKAYQAGDDTAKVIELTRFRPPTESQDLPPVWRADIVREFHEKKVS